MKDTPAHIKQLQLKIWLAKTPEQRLLQFLSDNDTWYQELLKFKKKSNKEMTK